MHKFTLIAVFLLGGFFTAPVQAEDVSKDVFDQLNVFGIEIGMTISAARSKVTAAGGELVSTYGSVQIMKSTKDRVYGPDNSTRPLYFKYEARSIPKRPHVGLRGGGRHRAAAPIPDKYSYSVNLYVYPKDPEGLVYDPDNLVIYAMNTSASLYMSSMSKKKFGKTKDLSFGTLFSFVTNKYGRIDEYFSSKGLMVFSSADTLQGFTDPQGFFNRDVFPGYPQPPACASILNLIIGAMNQSIRGESTRATIQKGINHRYSQGGKIDVYGAWKKCGTVSSLEVDVSETNHMVDTIFLYLFDFDHYENALISFGHLTTMK